MKSQVTDCEKIFTEHRFDLMKDLYPEFVKNF